MNDDVVVRARTLTWDFNDEQYALVRELCDELERLRGIIDEVGNEHYVIYTGDRWTIEHSLDCRLSGEMHKCEYHEAVERIADDMDGPDPKMLGRWRITDIDEGLPSLERESR